MRMSYRNKKAASVKPLTLAIIIIIGVVFFAADRLINNEASATIEVTSEGVKQKQPLLYRLLGVDYPEDEATEGSAYEQEDAQRTLSGPYAVTSVADGDTFHILYEGEDARVRLIGIDTPESVHPDESKNTEEGKIASDFTKELLSEEDVYLEFDVETRDNYGRLLAYAYILDDTNEYTMVQDILLQKGYARTMTIQPNSKYSEHFAAIQTAAREKEEGFWGNISDLFSNQ